MTGAIGVIRELTSRTDQVLALYRGAWWARDRVRADVDAMLASTPIQVGLVDLRTDELVAFCRALTDRTFLALILDVIVAPARRGQGLGERLMDELLAIPEVRHAASIELVCQPELIPFYERWGFTANVARSTLMRKATPAQDRDRDSHV